MNKTKIVTTGSLRRLCLVLSCLMLLVTSFLAMFPTPHASAAVVSATEADSRAKAYCESPSWHYSKDKTGVGQNQVSEVTACERGYNSSIQGQQVDYSTVCDAQDIIGIDPHTQPACEAGFKQGQREFNRDNQQKPSPTEAAAKATTYCTDLHKVPADIKACEKGYQAAILGNEVDPNKTCNGGNKDACKAGFLQGLREYQLANGIANPSSPNNGNGGTSGSSDKKLGCEFLTLNPLNWIICPIVKTLVESIDGIDKIITNFLNVETGPIFGDSSAKNAPISSAYHDAWRAFRNIALGLMVVAGLIIVISQALGSEILDAYAVRKALPRILIAALAITLSWPLMQFAVSLSNDLGIGIRHLIYEPFSKLSGTLDLSFGGTIQNLLGGGLVSGAAVAGTVFWLSVGGLGTLLTLVATAGLAVLVAVLVLILRQIVITMLIILAPIAIVAYILPNTQKVYKLWFDSFSKALLMFPIIAGMIAAGRVFSAVSIHTGGPIYQIMGFIAYFAPYFMIPMSFRFAGGALSGLGKMVSDRSRGAFGAISNLRSNQNKKIRANAAHRIQAGNTFRNAKDGSARQKINERLQTASLVGKAGLNPDRWKYNLTAARETREYQHGLEGYEKAESFQILRGNDDIGRAIMAGDGSMESIRKYLKDEKGYEGDNLETAMSHIYMASKEMGVPALRTAALLSTVTSSTAYKDKDENIGTMLRDLDIVAGGNDRMKEQLIGKIKQLAPQAGRGDLVAPFDAMLSGVNAIGQARAKHPGDSDADISAREAVTQQVGKNLLATTLKTEPPGALLANKATAIEKFLPLMRERVEVASANALIGQQRLAQFTNPNLTPEQQRVMIDDGKGGQVEMTEEQIQNEAYRSEREYIEALASTKAWHEVAASTSPEKASLIGNNLLGNSLPGRRGNVLDNINEVADSRLYFTYHNDFRSQYGRELTERQRVQGAAEAAAAGGEIPPPPIPEPPAA